MTSNSLPSSSKDIRYGYLLFRKDGSLVSIDDLPSRVTVLPSLCAVGEVTFVGEIASSSFSGLPFLETSLAGKIKGAAATEEETASSSVPQFRLVAHPLYASSSCSSSSSMVDHLHDAVRTRVLFPDVSSPSESPGEYTTFGSSPPKSSPFYVPPRSKNVAAPSAAQVCLQAPTCEPLFCVSSGLGPHPTHLLCSERCPWSVSCNDPPAPESCGPSVLEPDSERDDANANGDNPAITIDAVSSAKENTTKGGGKSSIGNDADFKGKEKGEKLESTEFCTYFHRRVGCKRGRDCLYAHGSAGEKYAPIKKFVLTTNSSEKLEGKWRRNEPQYSAARGKEAVEGVIADRKVNFSEITCRTPGHTLSATDPAKHIKTHCTFFLRFGECDYWPACKFSHESPDRTRMWRGSRLPSRLKFVGGGSSTEKVSIEHGSKAGEAVELKNIPEGDS